jgi:hypothetical protein
LQALQCEGAVVVVLKEDGVEQERGQHAQTEEEEHTREKGGEEGEGAGDWRERELPTVIGLGVTEAHTSTGSMVFSLHTTRHTHTHTPTHTHTHTCSRTATYIDPSGNYGYICRS